MKKTINSRIRNDLFPEMPQSFADKLTAALKTDGARNADQRSADEAPITPVIPEQPKRRFPFGKVFSGIAVAVLAALCLAIAVFGIILPNVQKTHGATRPDGYRADFPVGKWTLTEVEANGSKGDPALIGMEMALEFQKDGSVTVKTVTGGVEGQYVYRYTFADNAIELTAEGGEIPVLPASGTYDPETDTLRFAGADGDGALIFTRMSDAVTPESKMSPEDMLEGLWCALSVDPGEDGLLEIRFYTEAAATERKALIIKDGVSYDGYSYTVEKWEQSQKNTGNLWYRFTFIDGDEELTIDLCMDTDGKEPIYMDWNLDKSEEGQKTYLKCPVIEADELPMQYTEYYGAGEGFVGFLAAVDLNGDGKPVRVEVASNDPNWFIEKGEEPELTVQIGRGEWTANEVLVWDSVIFADLDPNDGHGNVLLSVKRADGTIFTYELHLEDDTVVCGHVAEGDSKTNAAIPQFIVGKWTLTGIELYGSTGGPETSGLEMYLEFSDKESVTVTTVKETGTDTQTYRWRFVSGNQIELTNKDYVTSSIPYTFLYDAATDTLRMDPDGYGLKGMLVFSRTPDAVIPEPERKEIAALRTQYPEYFGLDTESGLKVFVCEFACDYFSCTLLLGKDKDKTLPEISAMRGTTADEMRSILSTYDIPPEKIEVIPYVNPFSSYAHNIDALYTSYVTWKIKDGLPYLDAVQFDIDGDGREELCTLTYGPTSGLFTVTFSVYRDGRLLAKNTFNLHHGELYFEKTADGLRLSHTYSQWADSAPQTDIWLVSLKGGRIVWTNEKTGEEFSGYWGDESWNLDGKEPASDDMSEVNVSRTYLCVGATAGDRIVPTPWGYLSELNGLEAVGNDRENAADGFVWVERTYITSVPDGQPKLVWGTLEHFKGDTPAALRLKTDLTDGGEPIVVHFALCDQPMEYGFLDEGIADAGPRLQEPTAETLFYADWDEDGVYEYLTYLKLPETGTCLISDGERTLVLSDCVSVRGFYSDLDSKSPYGNLILSTEAADGSERVYELHPEGDAIVIGAVLNGYCFSADTEERELMLGTPTDLLGAKYGCREVKGEALEPADEWLQASGVIERIMFGKREDNIKDGTLLHLVRALPCEIDGKPATLEPGVYMHLREWNEAMTEIVFLTEDERWITVHLDGTKPYAVGGIPLTDYFDNAPKG